jgi:hypothetical protein
VVALGSTGGRNDSGEQQSASDTQIHARPPNLDEMCR